MLFVVQSALCRSSQPLAGLMGRSQEDEEMIQCFLRASPNTPTLHVMDTRPRVCPLPLSPLSFPSQWPLSLSFPLFSHDSLCIISASDQRDGKQGSRERLRGLWILP